MNHTEKTELLEAFAEGVRAEDIKQLKQVLQRYEAMTNVSIIRQIQRENYGNYRKETGEDADRLRTMNRTLEEMKKMNLKGKGDFKMISKALGV